MFFNFQKWLCYLNLLLSKLGSNSQILFTYSKYFSFKNYSNFKELFVFCFCFYFLFSFHFFTFPFLFFFFLFLSFENFKYCSEFQIIFSLSKFFHIFQKCSGILKTIYVCKIYSEIQKTFRNSKRYSCFN